MRKKIKALIALMLCLACVLQPMTASAATFGGKTYVKEVILSYGKTEADAKSWLTNKGYKVLDYNLNEGADDTWSTKRAVYLGYKTTSDADEAITDMKLMNMNGSYSVQDYQMLLEQQKSEIRVFINNFMVAINEYRTNYKKGQQRAVAAYELLNLMYDNDTESYLGDLLLNKVKEEYTDKEYDALSKEEQSKVADLTTILMQANSTAVLAMEQIIATATDDGDATWTDRYQKAKSYDDMVSELMDKDDLTVSQAAKELAAEYDQDAKAIASKFADYKDYLKTYTDSGLTLSAGTDEVEAYKKAHDDFALAEWSVAGSQYEVLKVLENDDTSLLDLITGDDFDVQNEDRYMLYPLVASLTKGQRACLDFLPMSQIISMGINGDEALKDACKQMNIGQDDNMYVSIYAGVDRSMFSDEVALTGDALKLQNSTGKNAIESWTGYISSATKVLYCALGVSMVATLAAWSYRSHVLASEKLAGYQRIAADMEYAVGESVSSKSSQIGESVNNALNQAAKDAESVLGRSSLVLEDAGNKAGAQVARSLSFVESSSAADEAFVGIYDKASSTVDDAVSAVKSSPLDNGTPRCMSKVFTGLSIAVSCVMIALMVASIWSTISDLKEYYNAEFTPIPMHMVNQSVNEKDEMVYTYYTAVKCNREEAQLMTDSTKLLEDYGDVNGDVGRQWVALYTSTDAAAGDPITTKMIVQYEKTALPEECTPLSMFGESTVQNLTNKKAGYTYADSKKGIYLFYGADENAYVGSALTNGTYALIAGGSMIVFAAASYLISKGVGKKKEKNSNKEGNANA